MLSENFLAVRNCYPKLSGGSSIMSLCAVDLEFHSFPLLHGDTYIKMNENNAIITNLERIA